MFRLQEAGGEVVRQVEVARPLGAARLVPARYVTESARVLLLVALAAPHAPLALDLLARYDTVCLQRDRNTALMLVLATRNDSAAFEPVRAAVEALAGAHRGAQLDVLEAPLAAPADAADASEDPHELLARAQLAALREALPRLPLDTLVLLGVPHMEFNEEFLNRVRMNTIAGEQWFLPVAFARYAQFAHPRFVDAAGARPQQNTGRFNARHRHVLAFYKADYDAGNLPQPPHPPRPAPPRPSPHSHAHAHACRSALEQWQRTRSSEARGAAEVLAHGPLLTLSAPEPALLLTPQPPPCAALVQEEGQERLACLQRAREGGFAELDLGARHALAKLLLETQAELE
ncbi:Chondroitin sulfate synthase 2 [Papilio xuthus]|uniref:Hexosyltransferase n=1 Tax=Papilio xuthus TaxID=66420 RepID=A0A0N1IKE6_PAPXU|nr:Chondroitin sulfate synthase 2 [Papilio xuthus]